MKCPNCNGDCWRDEVNIGVGTQYGPWRCPGCGWYQGHEVDAMIDADMAAFAEDVMPPARVEPALPLSGDSDP